MGALRTGRDAPLSLLVLAGEPSGDRHAAELVRALAARVPCCAFGLAGPEMRSAGVEAVVPMEEVSVLGLTEVLRRLPALAAARRRLVSSLARRPDVVVPVDFPGFNVPFARRARRQGLPVLYYVSPQVWAWGRTRLRGIAAAVDRMAVVFPFELPLYQAVGAPVTYVGHPLADELRVDLDAAAVRAAAGLEADAPYLALLPGSREQEVRRLFPPMLDAYRRLRAARPRLGAIAAAASPALAGALERLSGREPGLAVVAGHTHAVAAHARAALVASGTATLETAALGTPLVIVYRLSWASWMLARRLVRLHRIGLANIVAGEDVAPELLQGRATGEEMARAAAPLVDDGPARARVLSRLAVVRERLGPPGASARAAELVLELAGRSVAKRALDPEPVP